MPPAWAAVLEASLGLFVQVQLGRGSPQTRNDLRFTLRHFPEHFTIELLVSPWRRVERLAGAGGIG